jgi:hypothetical protein
MRTWSDERGMTTLPTVTAASFALVAFLLLANMVLVHYGRGVARTAVDEAVRRATVGDGDVEVCLGVAAEVLADLLGGPYGSDLAADCRMSDGVVFATVEGVLPALVPVLPDFDVVARASASVDSG